MNLLDGSKTASRVGLDQEQLRRLLVVLLSVFLLIVAQVVRRRPGWTIDFLAPVIVYLALEHGLMDGLGLAVVIAYVADVLAGDARGLTVAVAVQAFLVLRLFVSRIIGASPVVVTGMVLLTSAFLLGMRYLVELVVGPGEAHWSAGWPTWPSLFGSAVVIGYPLYRLLRALSAFVRPRAEYGFSGNRIRP